MGTGPTYLPDGAKVFLGAAAVKVPFCYPAWPYLLLTPTWKRVSHSLPLGNTLGLTLDLKMGLDLDCWYWEHFGFQSLENKTLWF